MERYFKVKDNDDIREFASGLENGIFELESINDKGLLSLYTWDGLLLFAPDEVEEVPKPLGSLKNYEL